MWYLWEMSQFLECHSHWNNKITLYIFYNDFKLLIVFFIYRLGLILCCMCLYGFWAVANKWKKQSLNLLFYGSKPGESCYIKPCKLCRLMPCPIHKDSCVNECWFPNEQFFDQRKPLQQKVFLYFWLEKRTHL